MFTLQDLSSLKVCAKKQGHEWVFLYRCSEGISGRIGKMDSRLGWTHVPADGKLFCLGELDKVLQDGEALLPMPKGKLIIY